MTGVILDPDETVYRRIAFLDFPRPKQVSLPAWVAFRPNKNDVTGISLSRAEFWSVEQAAQGRQGKRYHVMQMRVGDLNDIGLTVVADDPQDDPSHAVIPELSFAEYNEDKAKCREIAKKIISSVAKFAVIALDHDEFPDLAKDGK